MRNLKKVLSLVLCLAMMLSVMVTGVSAAFTDQDEIDAKHKEDVDVCVILNIINGYPNGTFQPNGNITRAEMCKMICVMLNGGKEPTLGSTANSFTDVPADNWAAPYIASCVSQEIVAGIGNGMFNPYGNVTGSQAAKMLLIALGFNADRQNYLGAGWDINVNVDASARGFYVDLEDIDPSAALTREHAAEMIWNALNAYEVEYENKLVAVDGQLTTKEVVVDKVVGSNKDKITMLEDKYEVKAVTGDLVDVSKDTGKDTYTIDLIDAKYNGEEYRDGDCSFNKVNNDYSDLLYQNVRVLVQEGKNGKDDIVFGVYGTDKNTVQTGILKDLKMDGAKAKLDGTKYSLDDFSYVYVNGYLADADFGAIQDWIDTYGDGSATKYTDKAFMQPTAVKLIANDGTTDYSVLSVVTYAVGKVTGIGSDYVNVSYKNGDNSIFTTKCTDDDFHWYDGISKNDYVVVTDEGNYADDMGVIEKATVVSGKVTGVKGDDKFSVDGTQYTMAGKGAAFTAAPKLNAKVEAVVIGDYAYYTSTIVGSVDNVALLVEVANKGGIGSKKEARLIFSDGSDQIVNIEKRWDDKDDGDTIQNFLEGEETYLVSYEKSGDVYTLTQLGEFRTDDGDYDIAGYDYYFDIGDAETDGSIKNAARFAVYDDEGGLISGSTTQRLYYDSNAVVFVRYEVSGSVAAGDYDASYKVVSGKVAAGYEKDVDQALAIGDKSSNTYYAQGAFIDLGWQKASGSSDKHYAVALTDYSKDSSGGSTVWQVTGWDGTQEILYKSEDSFNISAGDIFEYTDLGNGLYDVDKVATNANDSYFVASYNEGTGDIELFDKNGYHPSDIDNIDCVDSKDTVVLYVSSGDGEGRTDGEIRLAYCFDEDYIDPETRQCTEDVVENVTCFFDDDDYITVIVVDVDNNVMDW